MSSTRGFLICQRTPSNGARVIVHGDRSAYTDQEGNLHEAEYGALASADFEDIEQVANTPELSWLVAGFGTHYLQRAMTALVSHMASDPSVRMVRLHVV